MSNAWPERVACMVKLLKNQLGSWMKNDVLNSLLHIHINGLEQFTPECDKFIRTTDCEGVENSEGQKESTKEEEEVRSKYPTCGCLCQ